MSRIGSAFLCPECFASKQPVAASILSREFYRSCSSLEYLARFWLAALQSPFFERCYERWVMISSSDISKGFPCRKTSLA